MHNFHNIVFPLSIGFGARGGPARHTEISTSINGHERRNSPHAHSRRRYDIGAGVKSLNDLHILVSFYEARRGQLCSFLFKDPVDHKSCVPSAEITAVDQILGQGDGVATEFSLIKTYQDLGGNYARPIQFPNPDHLHIAVDGAPAPHSFNDNHIILNTPPPVGARVTAGFEFYVPVRFDTSHLDIALEAFGAGQAISVPLIEVLADDT